MQQVIQLMLVVYFSHLSCHNMSISKQTREVFVQKINEKDSNYFELNNVSGSLTGVFHGIEIMSMSKGLLYYKATLSNLNTDGDKMSFTLADFVFSSKPFNDS